MTRFKLTVEYDGTGISGWQRQDDRDSVQGFLEAAGEKLAGHPCHVVGAGRTDAGVHATGQVAHVDIERRFTGYNVMQGFNYHLLPLTEKVVVTKAEQIGDDFHARFSAIGRRYRYRIFNRRARLAFDLTRAWHIPEPLDEALMQQGANELLGHHDFTSFRSSICQSKSPEKTLERLEVQRMGDDICIYADARSFLHHQVRNMTGTLRLVGNGKWTPMRLREVLQAKDRALAGETAPPQGLTLLAVIYN